MKYAWVEKQRDQFSVTRMCRLYDVSRSGHCQWRVRSLSPRAIATAVLDAKVAALHEASRRSYGRDRIRQGLRKQGLTVGHERLRKSMRRQGLRPVYKRAYRVTADSNHIKPIAQSVLGRRFDGWQVNRAWVADITYVATGEGRLYLAVVMDLASRRIVGWSMKSRISVDLVSDALKSAYWRRKPPPGLILHSDRGSQYASKEHRCLIKDYQMV
ncbi:MAG: IS3 family transposase [Rhodoferax sp.]|nr:IS3 family transposase [Rhodoferax sp.]